MNNNVSLYLEDTDTRTNKIDSKKKLQIKLNLRETQFADIYARWVYNFILPRLKCICTKSVNMLYICIQLDTIYPATEHCGRIKYFRHVSYTISHQQHSYRGIYHNFSTRVTSKLS